MHRQSHTFAAVALVAAALLAACGGGKNNRPLRTPAPSATAARATVSGPPPAAAQTASPRSTPFAGASAACSALGAGPGAPTPVAAPPTPEPPFIVGTQPSRPAVDLNEFTVNPKHIPAGFTSAEAPSAPPTKLTAADIARATSNPEATANHLNNIGFLGGRQQAWAGPQVQGRISSIYVLHLVFSGDAGAAEFLHNPAFGATICVKPEPGPQIGQETVSVFFQYTIPLATGGSGLADGHGAYWRCGRVVLVVTGSGAPGQITQGMVDDLARGIQADFVKKQPCS